MVLDVIIPFPFGNDRLGLMNQNITQHTLVSQSLFPGHGDEGFMQIRVNTLNQSALRRYSSYLFSISFDLPLTDAAK